MNKDDNSKNLKNKAVLDLEQELKQLIEEMDSRNKGIKKIIFSMEKRDKKKINKSHKK